MIHHEPLRSIMKLLLYSTVLKAIENHNDCYPDTKPHLCSGIVSLIHIFFFFRPKYFLFENVRNFASHEQARFLQLTLRCLLEIGYQVTFGVLNAGKYGVPQSRRRFFILGAAPGLELPRLPKPTHCFGSFKEEVDSIKVNNLIYDLGKFKEKSLFFNLFR